MKKLFALICTLFLAVAAYSQEEVVHSVYFEFDKHTLDEKQATETVAFIRSIDTTRIESIQIYGYTDDRGKDAYNYKLSANRASTIKNKLIEKGIKNKIIVTIEGKGRILLDEDIDNKSEARSKNRRVDVLINFKPVPPPKLEAGIYSTITKNMSVGDRVYLDLILFERGSSKLTLQSKKELEKVAKLMMKYKNLEFEIQGHICCTPTFQKEAIDKDTKKRALSTNRAQAVYKYLLMKKVPASRLTFKGYGNTKPLGMGSAYDRRVELVVTKI